MPCGQLFFDRLLPVAARKAKAANLAARGEYDAAAGRRRGRLVRAVNDLAKLLTATRQIVAQTRQRVHGHTPDGATRRVSLHDPDARPIAKGRLGKPVEFGHKAAVASFAEADDIPVVRFGKDDRKIDRMRPYLARQAATGRSGVAAIGTAQEFQNVFAASQRTGDGIGQPKCGS